MHRNEQHIFLRPSTSTRLRIVATLMAMATCCLSTRAAGSSPIQIELSDQFASFLNRDHPGNRIGYRFHEHTPLTYGDVPKLDAAANTNRPPPDTEAFASRPGAKVFHCPVTEDGWIPEDWTFYLAPAADGVDLLWVIKTANKGLPEFYGVQQCFRLTGLTNSVWRQKYAQTPAFSEFYLWKSARPGSELISLTWVLRDWSLQRLPPGKETVGCRTPYGAELDARRSEGHLDKLDRVGPYQARMLWTCDSGLILRTSLDQQWSTGLYWERTTHVTDHHPADCLHAIVNIGGIPPHSQLTLRGKIYWLEGSGDTLLEHWQKDFPGAR